MNCPRAQVKQLLSVFWPLRTAGLGAGSLLPWREACPTPGQVMAERLPAALRVRSMDHWAPGMTDAHWLCEHLQTLETPSNSWETSGDS